VPIWKHEVWADGEEWGTGASELSEVSSVPSPTGSD
jgi:molybdopterin synthase catalytic subunit